eukprot:2416140-Pyramimonas_sp.AAC.1
MRLHRGQDLSNNNVDIIGRVASFVDSVGQPMVVGADSNVPPDTFKKSGVLDRLGGQIVFPGSVVGAYSGTGGLELYDSSLVTGGLEKAIADVRANRASCMSPRTS